MKKISLHCDICNLKVSESETYPGQINLVSGATRSPGAFPSDDRNTYETWCLCPGCLVAALRSYAPDLGDYSRGITQDEMVSRSLALHGVLNDLKRSTRKREG